MARIEEIYWLRSYGCIAVFCFHLLDRLNQHFDNVYLDLARIPTVLGTPTFVFISIFLFSTRYAGAIPEGFLANRIKYVMAPYVVYGLIYSTTKYVNVKTSGGNIDFISNLVEYLLYAGWHGYFLIIAMQFYVFYWAYTRYRLERFLPPGPWLVLGSLIGMLYWGLTRLFEFEPPGYLLWVAPWGWLYLFFLALLMARYYPNPPQITLLRKLSHPGWLAACLGLIVLLSLPGWLEYSSKETWVVPLFLLSILVCMRYLHDRPAPPLVKKINEYSFGIYLAHPLFFAMVDFSDQWMHLPPVPYALLMIVAGLGGPITLSIAVNQYQWSGVLFGKQLAIR
ncbi:hypothetical protein L861_16985 [Litchfieldella anticariensis FP35 = DSM 16096]|uniref:Acyltransferase 3 domain-containing protein n=1 Tax=Litchfieldella anticariensis (strain DSM 16096 / CECT 5854 / CIP 108499 / LMG 22089 / FP35) TaxID=1121939 RepID=S2KHG4_LITA3|nr:acyltransferase family protein [Halomonas anticariensis]EPC01567.1 hypothetical protein L861_16985 [Halomonas anticariensis FP35 = DSM 16096]